MVDWDRVFENTNLTEKLLVLNKLFLNIVDYIIPRGSAIVAAKRLSMFYKEYEKSNHEKKYACKH